MKKIITFLILTLCFSAVQAEITEFDYTISDATGYEILPLHLDDESLLVTGAGADEIFAKGESYIEVRDTSPLQHHVGGIYSLGLDDFSTMNYYDGEMGGFSIYDSATATFSGGRIDYISSYQDSDVIKHITFVCDVSSVNLTGNLLTGDWLNGAGSFSITLQNQTGYDSVYSNINFIPEPATLALLALGGMLIRKKQ